MFGWRYHSSVMLSGEFDVIARPEGTAGTVEAGGATAAGLVGAEAGVESVWARPMEAEARNGIVIAALRKQERSFRKFKIGSAYLSHLER